MVVDEAAERQKLEAKGEAEVRKWLEGMRTRDKRTDLAKVWLGDLERKRETRRYWIAIAVAAVAAILGALAFLQ